jgi:endonuclease/exonuclease/phosphatase family metal-dependent hydrolase
MGCSAEADLSPKGPPSDDAGAADTGQPFTDGGGTVDGAPIDSGAFIDGAPDVAAKAVFRVLAGNLSSGNDQSYDPGEGIRILQGLAPDVALLQEFNYGGNTDADARRLVDTAFGADFSFYREPNVQIPNAVVSRFPISESGAWPDPQVQNRSFAYAKVQIPGGKPLWAISVHLLTTGSSDRTAEATALVARIKTTIPQDDWVVIGGDLNTGSRTEGCLTQFSQVVVTTGPFPADGRGNENTNANRSKPLDWVLPSPNLAQRSVPAVIGSQRFDNGLVFDSRVFTPLTDVAPVRESDCDAPSMQHMAVVRDFRVSP